MATLSFLAISVVTQRAGYVFMYDGEVQDWGVIIQASRNANDLVGYVQELINELKPDVVVTESLEGTRKGQTARRLIKSVAELASHNPVLDVSVPRQRRYKSKYEEADAMAKRYPPLTGYRPKQKRNLFGFEPRQMVLFEAVALAEAVIYGPPDQLAAAMG